MIEPLTLSAIPVSAESLRPAVRAFLDDTLRGWPMDRLARSWMGFDAEFSRALASRGWVGMTLPEAYGGGGKDAFHRFVLAEELLCRGAPVSAHWIADRQSGPLILKYGTAAQRDFFLPKICKAELFFCIGMSEPQSGSDLAGLRTRATRTAEGWVLKGQKLWTTNAHRAHYMIALVRSSGTPEDRHQGLSQMIIDLSLPGITVRTIGDLTGDQHFNEVFFDDVLLPPDALIGEEGAGWAQVTAELAFERSGPERIYGSMVLFDAWLQHLRSRSAPTPAELALAGRILTQLVPLREMSVALTAKLAQGESPVIEAALVKDLGTELEQAIPNLLADALAADPQAERPEDLLRTLSYVLQVCPTFSLRGGTREILRGVIARGLGLR
ncbi:MAG: acyl-CoA dehydrogenase family protein [Burkholderiaceae bacterium]|jgi:alkylation response protein AidB-like acyl-CoA dehydrogenase|nr:acyl-CoA dehydrogenase family protein [Burkholderiaceae bacterium]